MVSPEDTPELGFHARVGALSKRRFSSVTRTAISLAAGAAERGKAGSRKLAAGKTSTVAPTANPAADNLRKSRLVCSAIFPSRVASIRRLISEANAADKNLMRVKSLSDFDDADAQPQSF